MESFSIPIANKIFHVSVLLLIYYCDQFVASKIRHRRCQIVNSLAIDKVTMTL